MDVLVPILYIISFALFIYGLMGLTGPKTAVRGNWIAAAGMALAVVATLLQVEHNWLLLIVGLVVGTVLGVPSARQVKMTAMPQMVALFNGVGGGAVALISFVEYRDDLDHLGRNPDLERLIPILFAAIIGSVSFWGSNIAFGTINVIGGFLVTDRMLEMFKPRKPKSEEAPK